MTNNGEGLTLEQSMLGKHISGYMFPLCLETWTQIKVVKATAPSGATAQERETGLLNTSLFVLLIQGYPKTNLFQGKRE